MYVARDKNRMLYVFEEKPIKNKDFENWTPLSADENFMEINPNLFPEVKWEDEEPRELVLKPIKEELGFVNLYKDGGQVKVGWKIFPTKKEAEENFKDDEKYITTANIQWRNSHDNL